MSTSHVVVIATDLRRATVKVSPGTYMTDVLQEACKKLSLSGDKYVLKHKQRHVDLGIPFRASGLTGGARLELVVKSGTPAPVSVALQLLGIPEADSIPGGRLVAKLPSDWTMWKVLRQFESGEPSKNLNINLNLTARGVARTSTGGPSGSGQLYYEMPVLNIMGRELATLADLQKTLSQLGYNSGTVLIRISFRPTDKILHQAVEEMSLYFKEKEEEEAKEASGGVEQGGGRLEPQLDKTEGNSEDAGVKTGSVPGSQSEPTNLTTTTTMPDREIPPAETCESSATNSGPGPIASAPAPAPAPQPVDMADTDTNTGTTAAAGPSSHDLIQPEAIFASPASSTPIAAHRQDPDGAFVPSIAHAQLHQSRLLASTANKRLLSDQELEVQAAQEATKIASVSSVRTKVRFPDNTSAIWRWAPEHTGATLHRAVRQVMAAENQPFRLVLPADRTVIRDADSSARDSLIRGYKLSGGVVISLLWDDAVPAAVRKQPFLKEAAQKKAVPVVVAEAPQATAHDDEPAQATTSDSGTKLGGGGESSGLSKKIPKWLRRGKK